MIQPLSPLPSLPEPDTRIDVGGLAPHAKDTIAFPEGLPGFEACRRFVVMSYEGTTLFQCVQGLEASRPAFLVTDPARVLPGFRMQLSPADRRRLDVREDDTLVWLAIVTIGDDESATVNLRAPLVVNPRLMIGFQMMPHDCLYPLRHPLSL
jgi:flagellar assembly factor FliW